MSINGSFNTFSPSIDGLFNFDVNNILVNGSMVVSGTAVFTGNTTFTASANFTNNITQSTTGIITQSGTGSNTLKAITMVLNNNFTMTGSGRITQASTTATNLLNPTQFQGDITFTAGVSRINQTSGGNGAILRQLDMLANYDIIFASGNGKINQTNTTGVNTMSAITMNSNSTLTQSGTGIITQSGSGSNTLKAITMVAGTNFTQTTNSIIDQSSSTGGVNLLKAITMNANDNITQSGTSIIDQTTGTGENILYTLKFNDTDSITKKHITLYETSPTNLATNYTISVEGSRIRYNVNSGASHIFSTGTGVSSYTLLATINNTGLTLSGNRNLVQTGSGIINQTGTGINLMKNITQNVDCNLLQSGIGVITQSGTGTNALKGSTFSGNNTHYNGSAINQYDSTNTYFSQLSQSGANYFISNDTNGGVSVFRNKTSGGVVNDMTISATDIFIDKNTYIRNSNVLVLTDGLSTYTQTNISQSGGNLYIQNLNLTGGYIYINAYNGTSLETYILIHYTAFSLRTGVPLRVFDTTNAYYTELSQSGTSGYLSNANNGGTLYLRTKDSSGNYVNNITMTPTTTTIANNLVCNGTTTYTGSTQFNNDLIVYTTTNYLKLSDGTTNTRLSQNLGDCLITNTKTYSGGFGDVIVSTTDTGGTTSERFRVSHDKLKTNVNITLPTSGFVVPTTNQLGYVNFQNISTVILITMGSGTIYNYSNAMLFNQGTWIITFQLAFKCTTAGTITSQSFGISTSPSVFDNQYTDRMTGGTAILNNYYTHTFSRTISISSPLYYYALMSITFSSGVYQFGFTSGTDAYWNFSAVRIA